MTALIEIQENFFFFLFPVAASGSSKFQPSFTLVRLFINHQGELGISQPPFAQSKTLVSP